ncbi:hypothetical protein AZZ62_002375, partial [Klebsiella variicola]
INTREIWITPRVLKSTTEKMLYQKCRNFIIDIKYYIHTVDLVNGFCLGSARQQKASKRHHLIESRLINFRLECGRYGG